MLKPLGLKTFTLKAEAQHVLKYLVAADSDSEEVMVVAFGENGDLGGEETSTVHLPNWKCFNIICGFPSVRVHKLKSVTKTCGFTILILEDKVWVTLVGKI